MRITIGPQNRRAEHLPWCTSLADAQARAELVQGWVNRLRAAGQAQYLEKAIEERAMADAAKLAGLERMVTALAGDEREKIPEPSGSDGPVTFRKFAERWTDGDLARLCIDDESRMMLFPVADPGTRGPPQLSRPWGNTVSPSR